MQTAAFLVALLVMVVGVAGTFIPALPGLPLIFIAMLGYGYAEGFREITSTFLVVVFIIVSASFVAEHYARAWGAQRFGAGRAGTWGAVIGSLVGLFFMPVGLLVGPFAGAMLGELLAGRSAAEAVRAGWGGLLGVLGSIALNVVLAVSLTIAFALTVIF